MIGFQHDAVADTDIQYRGILPKVIQATLVAVMGSFLDHPFIYIISHGALQAYLKYVVNIKWNHSPC